MKKYWLVWLALPFVLFAKEKQEYILSEGKGDEKRLDFQNDLFHKELCKAFTFASAMVDLEGKVVVDFGCGVSSAYRGIATFIGENGTYIGIDSSKKQIEVAQAKNPHIEYLCGDQTCTQIQEVLKRADIIYLRAVVMHQKDPQQFLEEFYSILRPGTVVLIQEPENTVGQKNMMRFIYPHSYVLCTLKDDLGRRRGFDYNFAGKASSVLSDLSPSTFIHLHENLWATCKQAKVMYEGIITNVKQSLLKDSFSEEELGVYVDALEMLPDSNQRTWILDELHTFIVQK
ncbi:class I SAM-dependent methyltransferase [bacterium]|nr:class I SAM-dependent methyltransferase [bacterium]